jgi:hypothetical protein
MDPRASVSYVNAASVSTLDPFGKVFTPKELGALWQLSENSIRRLFQDEPGVFVMGTLKARKKRGYTTLRIPESVAARVWRERLNCLK